MKIEDVALTVSGVIATMALAYLFYRKQQGTAAAAVQPSQDATDYTTQGQLYDSSVAYQYSSQLPTVTVPTISTSQPANVDTSASTAETGSQPSTDIDNIFSQILADFHGAVANSESTQAAGPAASVDFSDYAIPVIDTQPVVSTSGIAVTASDAQQQAEGMLPGGVTASPIVHTGDGGTPWDPANPPIPPGGGQIWPGEGGGTNQISVFGGLTSTSTAATPAPSNQPVATTSPSLIHNMHVMGNQIAQSI
jgi:hypothetical protein